MQSLLNPLVCKPMPLSNVWTQTRHSFSMAEIRKSNFGEFNTQEIEKSLILVFRIIIIWKGGIPVNVFRTWKIDLGSDERIK